MSAPIENEIEVQEKSVTLSYKMREQMAILYWSMQNCVINGVLTTEQRDGCYNNMKFYAPVAEQITHYETFSSDKKCQMKAMTKAVKDHHKPPKVKASKREVAVVDGDPKTKRTRASKVVQIVVSNEDSVISNLVNAANNIETIVVPSTASVAAQVTAEIVVSSTTIVTEPVDVVLPTKQKKVKEADSTKAEAKALVDAEKAAAKALADSTKAAAKAMADAEKAAAKALADSTKAAAKAMADAEKAAAKAAKEQAKTKKVVATKPTLVPVPVPVTELELVAEEDDTEEGEGFPFEYNGTTYVVEPATGSVYNENLDTEIAHLVFRDGAIYER